MKKLVVLLLALTLLLPAISYAEELDFYCAYAHAELLNSGAPYLAMLCFSEDGTCYFTCQMFSPDEPMTGRSYVGTWEYNEDGDVFAKIGENATMTLHFVRLGDVMLIDTKTLNIYSPVNILNK